MIELMDGVQKARDNPDTFRIPTDAEKAAVQPGDYVKCGFIAKGGRVERMWVEVCSEGKGMLASQPVLFPADQLALGSFVEFEPRHIINILRQHL